MRVVPYTFSSLIVGSCGDISRADGTTKLIDFAAVRQGPLTVLSLFGYNAGAQQFLQLHDIWPLNGSTLHGGVQPLHSFVVAAANNFSFIIPVTGMCFDNGLVLALSSTAGFYTANGSKDMLFSGTLSRAV